MSDTQQEDFGVYEKHREEIEKALEAFEAQLGLPKPQEMSAPRYLTMSVVELRAKSPEELSEAVFEINQYSLYIQRIINRNRGWERWAKSKLNEVAASYLPKVSGHYGFNERELICKNTPSLCKHLNAFLRKVGMELDRLYDLPNQLKNMADTIRELKFIALRREKNYGESNE